MCSDSPTSILMKEFREMCSDSPTSVLMKEFREMCSDSPTSVLMKEFREICRTKTVYLSNYIFNFPTKCTYTI
jgi:hypothetical protein